MNSKQRLLNVLARKKTDRLPVTTHHLMPSFLKSYMKGISDQDFFDYFGLDPIKWVIAYTYDESKGEFFDPTHTEIGFLEARRICTDNWRFSVEDIAAMNPDAMETFTPPDMGGDTNLAEAKQRIGHKVCMIGGFDQFHFFTGCTENATRKEVRRCFEAAGGDGGFILSPSDHFFEADMNLLRAFAAEAKQCIY